MRGIFNKISYLLFIGLFFLVSCSESSNSNTISNSPSKKNNTKKSVNGVYKYSDSSVESTVTVSGNSWMGKLLIRSGLGSTYDNTNASYSSGIVRDGILYDDSGYIELGSVNVSSLSIPIGSSRVTHYK